MSCGADIVLSEAVVPTQTYGAMVIQAKEKSMTGVTIAISKQTLVLDQTYEY